MTPTDLIAFEAAVAAAFERGAIRNPIHLSGGNETQLIRIFQDILPGDWVFGTWRSHSHALLHGIPPDELMSAILAGRSISLCFPQYKFLCSGIVAGAVPIAVGVAVRMKRRWPIAPDPDQCAHVWCFVGDMAARTGAFHEARAYAVGHDLPIWFIIEDNRLSVKTKTGDVWGDDLLFTCDGLSLSTEYMGNYVKRDKVLKTIWYRYDLTWPHSGIGKRVEF